MLLVLLMLDSGKCIDYLISESNMLVHYKIVSIFKFINFHLASYIHIVQNFD